MKMMKKVLALALAGAMALCVLTGCGGYNLHWAFGSGIIAGRAAAKLRKKKK